MSDDLDRLSKIELQLKNIESSLSLLRDVIALSSKINQKCFASQAFLRNFSADEIAAIEQLFIWAVQNKDRLILSDFLKKMSENLPNYKEEILENDGAFWKRIAEGYLEQGRMTGVCEFLLKTAKQNN